MSWRDMAEIVDWIPPELGQQTQTLLRMTMESKLTAKVSLISLTDLDRTIRK